ncbi:MAG: M15 family metallopeptidase [Chloroflexota bacterium]
MTRRVRAAALLCAALTLAGCANSSALPSSVAPTASLVATTSSVAISAERLASTRQGPRPPQPALVARYQAALVADHCVDRDLPAPTATDPVLVILDRTYALPAGAAPQDLVVAAGAGLRGTSGDKLVRAVLLDDLAAMRAAWDDAGLSIAVESAHRSVASQAATFDSWVARLGYDAGLLRTARPGHSEHHLGTAIDVTSPGWAGRVGDWAAETAEGAWMAAHAWEYGFVMSYPAGATDETCFGYEPWHYRWIGREVAAQHRASGLTLRRFLERYATG